MPGWVKFTSTIPTEGGSDLTDVDNLTDLTSMHRAVEGCRRIYFGMSVSAAYLVATVNTTAVARHHGLEVFANMSQMTISQMSISETTGRYKPSPM